ncbi:MAG: flagellar hook-associated protein FlgL [Gammaproteobacteria bacterium]|nr:flagellar hook-associated protein FlgL [Gammaproteobacteria bacterium]
MRISTLQMYKQSVQSMQAQQSGLHRTESQLASGKRINKPSDDPIGAAKVLNLNSTIAVIDQFSRNVAGAESSLAFEENVIASVNNSLQRVRELAIQGNNATNSYSDRQVIAQEIYQKLDELTSLANTRDGRGDYIFGGFSVDNPPFANISGSIVYQGDQGQRFVQIGEGTQTAVGDSGESVFSRVSSGNGTIEIAASSSNSGDAIVGAYGHSSNYQPGNYTITFNQAAITDPIAYVITNDSGATISSGTYNEGESIAFTGVHLRMSGNPADGDVVNVGPSQNRSIFDAVKGIADALNRPTEDSAATARLHNELAQGLGNLDQGLDHLGSIRAGIGSRLNNIESIQNINQDLKLQLETIVSKTQDLDYAEAISRFNLQLTSLQAAQQAFIKTSGLTLFQYL